MKSFKSTASRIAVLKRNLGELPLDALEEPDEINEFKTGSVMQNGLSSRIEPSKHSVTR